MSTRDEILAMLKKDGAATSQTLAKRLTLTPMAVKLQLYDLESEGVVRATVGPRSRGRPSKVWHLTEKSEALFPNSHAALCRDILVGIRTTLGEAALDTVLRGRASEQRTRYADALRPLASLKKKLQRLAELRTEEGYMATVEEIDGVLALVENHCPICTAARECVKLCADELKLFQQVIGAAYRVERTEHIVKGARRCVYLARRA